MIRYPVLKESATIGVTAPSSGVEAELHDLIRRAERRLAGEGFRTIIGDTVWQNEKTRSASAEIRAEELNRMMLDGGIDLLIPPWGGELLIEVLEHLDIGSFPPKWILGYSDISVLLLAITLTTGIATAHGTNLIDLRGEYSDDTTAMWKTVLSTPAGGSVQQHSSAYYQKEWDHDHPTSCVFLLTEPTRWEIIGSDKVDVKGRLLGGCLDVIRHLIGTPFGDLARFREVHIGDEPVIWYFENCEMGTTDLRRTLMQMRLSGWFEKCSAILFGRSPANHSVGDYEVEDVYRDLFRELRVPIVYDIDCGHVPPQMTFVNGAYAEVKVGNGQGTVRQTFLP